MLFLASILFAIIGVLMLMTISTIKAGKTLPKFQNNIAVSYLNTGRKIGFGVYNTLTYLLTAWLMWKCLAADPFPALVPLAVFSFFTVAYYRASKVLRSTRFLVVDDEGYETPNGKYLKPAA